MRQMVVLLLQSTINNSQCLLDLGVDMSCVVGVCCVTPLLVSRMVNRSVQWHMGVTVLMAEVGSVVIKCSNICMVRVMVLTRICRGISVVMPIGTSVQMYAMYRFSYVETIMRNPNV